MKKKNSSLPTVRRFYFIVFASIILALVIIGFRALYSPQRAGIFLINDGPGETVVTGIVQKDTAVGVEGNYLLIIEAEPPVLLDVEADMDSFLGQTVEVGGYYTPKQPTGQPATLRVSTVKLQ